MIRLSVRNQRHQQQCPSRSPTIVHPQMQRETRRRATAFRPNLGGALRRRRRNRTTSRHQVPAIRLIQQRACQIPSAAEACRAGPSVPGVRGHLEACREHPLEARPSPVEQPTGAPEHRTAHPRDNAHPFRSVRDLASGVPEPRTRRSTARSWEAKAAGRGVRSTAKDAP